MLATPAYPRNFAELTYRDPPLDIDFGKTPKKPDAAYFHWVFYHWCFWSGSPCYCTSANARQFFAAVHRMRGTKPKPVPDFTAYATIDVFEAYEGAEPA